MIFCYNLIEFKVVIKLNNSVSLICLLCVFECLSVLRLYNIFYFLQDLESIQKDKYVVKYNTNIKKMHRTYITHIYVNKLNPGILY